jgi:hypothetical protein
VRFRPREAELVAPFVPDFFNRGSSVFHRALSRSSSSRTAAMTCSGGGGVGSEKRALPVLRGCGDLRCAVRDEPP